MAVLFNNNVLQGIIMANTKVPNNNENKEWQIPDGWERKEWQIVIYGTWEGNSETYVFPGNIKQKVISDFLYKNNCNHKKYCVNQVFFRLEDSKKEKKVSISSKNKESIFIDGLYS